MTPTRKSARAAWILVPRRKNLDAGFLVRPAFTRLETLSKVTQLYCRSVAVCRSKNGPHGGYNGDLCKTRSRASTPAASDRNRSLLSWPPS
jgi:hypothetical protein